MACAKFKHAEPISHVVSQKNWVKYIKKRLSGRLPTEVKKVFVKKKEEKERKGKKRKEKANKTSQITKEKFVSFFYLFFPWPGCLRYVRKPRLHILDPVFVARVQT